MAERHRAAASDAVPAQPLPSGSDPPAASSARCDPSLAFEVAAAPGPEASGFEPQLGGALRLKAVWVDEAVCIGCRYCAHVAANTFVVEPDWGRSRAIRQDGDSSERIQEAIDTCPVDCIHWVTFESLPDLEAQLAGQEILPLGLPNPARPRRTLPRAPAAGV
ncbi:MAG: ferredoxin [Synechococcaceae cyanobacterium]|nr:ferredoxin [Synechococcaceae cyanobacterium]